MKNYIFLTVFVSLILLLPSCDRQLEYCESGPDTMKDSGQTERKTTNPYSLRVMQAALDSLMATRNDLEENSFELEATDYYVRINPFDTTAIASIGTLDLELFDYPLDSEFEDDTEYCFNPDNPSEIESDWYYTAVPVEYVSEEIPYEDVLEAEDNGSYIEIEIETGSQGSDDGNDNGNEGEEEGDGSITCELIDECYVPEHDDGTRSGRRLPVSAAELEAMAYKIAGVKPDNSLTKASKAYPSGYVRVKNGSEVLPVKGVKVRAQKFIKWRTAYTDVNGRFFIPEKFSKPNVSVVYSNVKDFTLWGNYAFLAAATFTVNNCTTFDSFCKEFNRESNYAPWSWSVINNAAYDYYSSCAGPGLLCGVATPPAKMKLWCMNMGMKSVGGSAPMMKHLITSRVLSGSGAVLSFLTSINWVIGLTVIIAAAINVMGPDILIVTHNKTYDDLYAVTFHELSHASHFTSIGEWNYGKLIWYEMTHGNNKHLYGVGGTGSEGEGYCEVSETYAFSIENFVRHRLLGVFNPERGQTSYYFFADYVKVLSRILIDGTLSPAEVFSCLTQDIKSMDSLLECLCNRYPSKASTIQKIMSE